MNLLYAVIMPNPISFINIGIKCLDFFMETNVFILGIVYFSGLSNNYCENSKSENFSAYQSPQINYVLKYFRF